MLYTYVCVFVCKYKIEEVQISIKFYKNIILQLQKWLLKKPLVAISPNFKIYIQYVYCSTLLTNSIKEYLIEIYCSEIYALIFMLCLESHYFDAAKDNIVCK